MAERQPLVDRVEAMIRLFWTRLGAALDRTLGRNQARRIDLGGVVETVEREIEAHLRKEGGSIFAPDRIDVRFDYETYAQLSELQIDVLGRDLNAGVAEFIHNRRYLTASRAQVQIGFDPFARRPIVTVKFSDQPRDQLVAPEVSPSRIRLRPRNLRRAGDIEAHFTGAGTTIGIGRSRDNPLVIDDASVSNFHASFTLSVEGSIWLADLDSSNGTTVNGAPLLGNDRLEVRESDRLRFGDVELTLELSQIAVETRPESNRKV